MDIHISAAQTERINRVAIKIGKSPQAIISAALNQFLDRDEWLNKAIGQGIESATKEPRVSHEQAWQNFEKRREQHLKKQHKAA
jgi:predicted transcriptional regulator